VIFNTSETGSIDWSQVIENDSSALRLNVSSSQTFVKYTGSMPSSVASLSSASNEYSHSAILNVLTGSEWSWDPDGET
jgi:hypothetical protein